MTEPQSEPAPDAGINALRLDADRARDDLERTLTEIETRLNPQRVIQPVARAARGVRDAYSANPPRFFAVAVAVAVALGGIITVSVRRGHDRG
jgi:hypothetical protein